MSKFYGFNSWQLPKTQATMVLMVLIYKHLPSCYNFKYLSINELQMFKLVNIGKDRKMLNVYKPKHKVEVQVL